MSDPDEHVELLRTGDPMRAEMLREMLRGEGISAATPGLEHRAMVGPLAGYIEIVVKVPRGQLERAKELLASLDAAPLAGLEVTDDDVDEPNVDYRTSARSKVSTLGGKRRRVALVASLFIPGGGHVYVSQWRSAAIIALTEIAALVLTIAGMPLAILLLPMAILADFVGATWHCERLAGSTSSSGARRFAPELAASIAVAWIALQMGPGAAWLAGPGSTQICTWAAECNDIDRRRCLWDAAASRYEQTIARSCEQCLGDATDCESAYECDSCWQP